MKKIHLLFILVSCYGIAQQESGSQEISSFANEVPNITPPSPTVASLMKFEEIPVNNYTGIPDISVPIYSAETMSKDININLSLNYHPSSIAADEVAAYTGLGWNLITGGTISRTVRGLPDEFFKPTEKNIPKVGIYYDSNYGNDTSSINYYYALENLIEGNGNEVDKIREFKFMAFEKGKFDTEYDLYQYNVMGLSGRFIIKKERGSQSLIPVQIDDNRQYKIEVNYELITLPNNGGRNTFNIKGFTITDERGNRYVFTEENREMVTNTSHTSITQIFEDDVPDMSGESGHIHGYPSAFQLSKILDFKGNLIATFNYKTVEETNVTKTNTFNKPDLSLTELKASLILGLNEAAHLSINKGRLEPWSQTSINFTTIQTKKLESIDIENKNKILFSIEEGTREDIDRNEGYRGPKLKEIVIKDSNNQQLKRIAFDYSYFTHPWTDNYSLKRMILKKIKEHDSMDSAHIEYEFDYKTNNTLPSRKIRKDFWGYLEFGPRFGVGFPDIEEKTYITMGVLEKMHLPTGGVIEFDFEPNTYSYVGDKDENLDFDENPENIYLVGEIQNIDFDIRIPDGGETYHLVFDNTNSDYYGFEFMIDYTSLDDNNWISNSFTCAVRSSDPNEIVNNKFAQLNEFQRLYKIKAKPGSKYFLDVRYIESEYWDPNQGPSPYYWNKPIHVLLDKYKRKESNNYKYYLYGGGVRIKDVSFFDGNQSNSSLALNTKYDYSVFGNKNRSSGSLAFAIPNFEFNSMKTIDLLSLWTYSHFHEQKTFSYTTRTDFNNLKHIRTQGADVGYENITVRKMNNLENSEHNGKAEFTYISPKTFPEIIEDSDNEYGYVINYPFIPSANYDYKRGHLQKSEVFNQNGDTLQVTSNDFSIIEKPSILTGVRLARNSLGYVGNPFAYIYTTYQHYKSRIDNCQGSWDPGECPNEDPSIHVGNCMLREEYLAQTIRSIPLYEASGWVKLNKTTTKEYFYNGAAQSIVETVQDFTYNDLNKQTQTQSTTNSLGETIKTEYKYPQDLVSNYQQSAQMQSLVSQNRISEAVISQTYTNGSVTSEKRVLYGSFGNRLLPQFVFTKKGEIGQNASPEDKRITFNRYNANGNLEQYTLENGTPVSIIWGYNGQYPIAKVEGLPYSSVQDEAAALLIVSNNGSLNPSSFESLRNKEGALVTSYIYKPLVGVTTIIQPNGQREMYEYDATGRLKEIKDQDGNVLKKVDYHYQNQP